MVMQQNSLSDSGKDIKVRTICVRVLLAEPPQAETVKVMVIQNPSP